MRRSRVLMITVVVLIALTAMAAQRVGPTGEAAAKSEVAGKRGAVAGSGGPPPPTSLFTPHCHAWKLGDRNDFGTTWVSSNDAFIYSGAGLQFTPNKHTAPEAFQPGPDLAGVIGVGFAHPSYVPSSVEISYSFLPVSRSSATTLQPPPSRVGLAWFNEYAPGNSNPAFEQQALVYPAAGNLNYPYQGWNTHTRYLVYVKTGDNGRGVSANDRGFAASGQICFNP